MKKKNIICITCIDLLCENGYNMSFIFNVVIPFNTLDRCPFKYELYRRFKIIYTLNSIKTFLIMKSVQIQMDENVKCDSVAH